MVPNAALFINIREISRQAGNSGDFQVFSLIFPPLEYKGRHTKCGLYCIVYVRFFMAIVGSFNTIFGDVFKTGSNVGPFWGYRNCEFINEKKIQ